MSEVTQTIHTRSVSNWVPRIAWWCIYTSVPLENIEFVIQILSPPLEVCFAIFYCQFLGEWIEKCEEWHSVCCKRRLLSYSSALFAYQPLSMTAHPTYCPSRLRCGTWRDCRTQCHSVFSFKIWFTTCDHTPLKIYWGKYSEKVTLWLPEPWTYANERLQC